MGMYTQVKGYLNVDSIGYATEGLSELLQQAKDAFVSDDDIACSRKEIVTEDTIIHFGFNASAFVFIGSEFKNYCQDAQEWVRYLLEWFPNAEGRIDFQYEENESATSWVISEGEVKMVEEVSVKTEGYGNCFKKRKEDDDEQ